MTLVVHFKNRRQGACRKSDTRLVCTGLCAVVSDAYDLLWKGVHGTFCLEKKKMLRGDLSGPTSSGRGLNVA